MTSPQMPSEDHKQFDAICSELGEWEPLPAVSAGPAELEEEPEPFDEETAGALDELILAGLVAP